MDKNYEIFEEDNSILLRINKNIYSKEIVIQTTYVLLEKYYFLIDEKGDYWEVLIKPKEENKEVSEEIVLDFMDELIESSSYLDQLKRTKEIRELILEKAILSQTIDDELLEIEKD